VNSWANTVVVVTPRNAALANAVHSVRRVSLIIFSR
jgi:hypothetical protein